MANPKLATLADQFGGAALNTALWNASAAAPNVQLDTVLDRVAVSCTTNYYALASTLWDATSVAGGVPNGVYARVVPTPVGNGSTQTFFEVLLDANNKATFAVSGGVFTAAVTNATVATTTTIAASWAAYDPYAYAWWRITEASGSFVFATSPDAYTWTTRATIAYTWNATAVKMQFVTGYYASEFAGMSAYIDHVNTTSSAPGQPNLNWPQIEDAWGPYWNANGGAFPLDRMAEVTDRTRGNVTVSRGRQYELDQVRSGEAGLTLANTDAALDPTNASGPWAGHIQPYQPYRRRAQWPPTRNLLDQAQATGGDLGGVSVGTIPGGSGGIDVFSSTDVSGGSIVSSASAWQGSNVFQFSVPNATAGSTKICTTLRYSALPGQTYTVQLRARNVTAATSLSVRAYGGYYTSLNTIAQTNGTPATLTGSATAAWTTLTCTFTVPAGSGAGGLSLGLALDTAAAAATCSIQVDGWQLEKGATATTWVCPGITSPVYAGWMERWSSQWDMGGTYGTVASTAVDSFSLLSQKQLNDPLTMEINSHTPRWLYKLDDPAGSTSVSDATGNYPGAQLAVSKYGAGSLTFGNTITSTDPGGTYTGSSGSVVRMNNPNPGTLTLSAATFIKLTSAGIKGPVDPTLWVRMIAFRYTGPAIASSAYLWSSMDGQRSGGSQQGSRASVYLDTSGRPTLTMTGPTFAGSNYLFGGATNCVDGDWHLLIFGYNQAANQVLVSQDGTGAAFYLSVPTTYTPTGLIADNIGTYVDATVGNATYLNFQGDISFACEFSDFFDVPAITNLYSAWKSSCAGESTAARYARILRYAGYSGASTIQTGLTTSMGAANIDGQDAMSALQAVVDTEGGAHHIDKAGFVQFRSRSARYNATVPMYTFGENPGEWPYEDVALDFDSTHLSNQVTVTQEGTSQNFHAQDATSTTNYFQRTLTRTVNSSSALECQDAANYLLSRYKNPATRVSAIKLHPSANPALWPVCLALELGTRVRVMRRPPGVPATQIECFVENIVWDFGDDGEAFQTLQCSPADLTPYGVFSAWHTTLKTAITAGATTITINPSQDTANPLAAQLMVGEVITLDPGTAVSENVTVSAVGATSPGWTSAVITLTAGTVNAHGVGAVVCDQLPAGTTDPTTWDAVSMFDSTAFAY
ncbi:hypothetical protein ACFXI6_14085 [Streptomyces mirabilis]|uniref:hypothetical protein n=1 Tax=Streptomyces mirabilis TaxID=68239 RepID=UPI0036AE73E7